MNDSTFDFVQLPEITGTAVIQHRVPPNQLYRIFSFEENLEFQGFLNKYHPCHSLTTIDGYRMVIGYIGNLGNFTLKPVQNKESDPIQIHLLEQAKQFYIQNRFSKNLGRFKRYKQVSQTS
jgi:hypothetical protein